MPWPCVLFLLWISCRLMSLGGNIVLANVHCVYNSLNRYLSGIIYPWIAKPICYFVHYVCIYIPKPPRLSSEMLRPGYKCTKWIILLCRVTYDSLLIVFPELPEVTWCFDNKISVLFVGEQDFHPKVVIKENYCKITTSPLWSFMTNKHRI